MRIALTYNLRRSDAEEHAEFDTPATIDRIARDLAELGHRVVRVEVSGAIGRFLARLERAAPDLVFNLAEGERGAFREAIYPALFEQLGLPHTGSSASALALCLDKALAKSVVAAAGVATPGGWIVHDLARHRDKLATLALPAASSAPDGARSDAWIIKPNFEGSSKGITQASIVADRARLEDVLGRALVRYPEGVLVEQFVEGADVSVAWCAGLGVLPPIRYRYTTRGRYRILDYAHKQAPESYRIEVPAGLAEHVEVRLVRAAVRAFDVLGVAGYGRADFRIDPDGRAWFLEMNPLPALGDDDLFLAAAELGVARPQVFEAILEAATPARALRRSA